MERLEEKSIKVILTLLFALASYRCGFDLALKEGIHDPHDRGGTGATNIIVKDSKGVDPGEDYGTVERYTVTVSGVGIDEPMTSEFFGTEDGGVIDGVPAGDDRLVKVTAANPDQKIIREGEAAEVVVYPDAVTEVEIELDAVPLFINLKEGNVIANTRLRFELFTDPDDVLEIFDRAAGGLDPLFDISKNNSEFYPDINTGLAMFVPQLIGPGLHTFEAVSKRTGRSSFVGVRIIDGKKLSPAPFFSGGKVGMHGEGLFVARAGFPLGASSNLAVIKTFIGPLLVGE